MNIEQLTPHKDVIDLLTALREGLERSLGSQLVGLYLTGSLTYGDFDPGSSDIDFLAILDRRELSAGQRARIREIHATIADAYPQWAARIEGSYITQDVLSSREPPERARPYINGGRLWDPDPRYGYEWLINLFALREAGVAIVGPDPKEIIPRVGPSDVREASIQDLRLEWAPKLMDPAPFDKAGYDSSHLQAYAILTMCRILYRATHDDIALKRTASDWVKRTHNGPWTRLVERAENWRHGQTLDAQEETLKFVEFVLKKIG